MHEVLFQNDSPASASGRVEFYDLCILQVEVASRRVCFFREIRGWWDNQTGKAIFDEGSATQTEAYSTYGEAFAHYSRQRILRINRGFTSVHTWHPVSGAPSFVRRYDGFEDSSRVA
jgi:hypothetical protein